MEHEPVLGADCKWVIGGCVVVVLALAGAIVKVAKHAWDERMARLNDHIAAQAQINVAKRAAKEKGGSPL